MKVDKILEDLKGSVSLECYNNIMSLIEGLFVNDGRGDLLDDISKGLTGKTLKQHLKIKSEKRGDEKSARLFDKPNKNLLP